MSPRCSVYRWCTAVKAQLCGWAMIRNTWKLWPSLSAVTSRCPLGSNSSAQMASDACAGKCAINSSQFESSLTLIFVDDVDLRTSVFDLRVFSLRRTRWKSMIVTIPGLSVAELAPSGTTASGLRTGGGLLPVKLLATVWLKYDNPLLTD